MTILNLAARVLIAASFAALPLACGGSDSTSGDSNSGLCTAGATEQCTCEDTGLTGARTCDETGAFLECVCDPCGNGTLDMGEACDGENLNGDNCASATMNAKPSGRLTCSDTCGLDTSACTGTTVSTGGAGGSDNTGGTPGMGGTMGGGATTGAGGLMGGGGTLGN